MKVFFASSTKKIIEYYPFYKLICKEIVSNGHELTRDWLDDAYENKLKGVEVNPDDKYDEILASILNADAGVIEGSIKGLSTGYQAIVSLQKSKPILLLHQDEYPKENQPGPFGPIYNKLLTNKYYSTNDELVKSINSFFTTLNPIKNVRFNLVLSADENNYLDWLTEIYDKSKTTIIRQLISNQCANDLGYNRILNKKS